MSEREIISRLIKKIEDMREAQKNYFYHRTDTWKKLSIALENDLDAYVKQLRRQGYEADKSNSEQNKLF